MLKAQRPVAGGLRNSFRKHQERGKESHTGKISPGDIDGMKRSSNSENKIVHNDFYRNFADDFNDSDF